MTKRHKRLYAALTAVLLSAGTATLTHALDARTAAHTAVTNQVRDYNDGFVTGACAASPTVAHDTYAFTCDAWN